MQLSHAASVQKQTQKSMGTLVFDWAWADAYQRNGVPYYPKLLCAVPFTPVQGTRLIAANERARRQLAATLVALAEQSEVSSLHVLFPTGEEAGLLAEMGMMLREGVQFHWLNDGYRHFDDFLATLEQKKRKNIRAERRKVAEAGVSFRRVRGEDASDADWRFFSRCYRQTYREHYSIPYLNLDFFRRIGETMPENLLLVIAEAEGKPIASALAVYARGEAGGGTLYGRYWGALEHVPCLHFETAYYQLLEFCIEEKLGAFEGGAQGEHKLARGFMPTVTHSAHWLAHPAFSDAVGDFLKRETGQIHAYVDELREHNPFKDGGTR
ncbi:GNAT family N-acetyltransferase [Burkholderia gladioli]|uniref:GNAT family N-acetyltransferase n=1 Tax=Burkholderia gladioli TaxID=28095 RepID=UPI0030B9D1A8